MECYDIKTPGYRTGLSKKVHEDEEEYKMGSIVFDEVNNSSQDFQPFVGQDYSKLVVLFVCQAGRRIS